MILILVKSSLIKPEAACPGEQYWAGLHETVYSVRGLGRYHLAAMPKRVTHLNPYTDTNTV